jgi:hypothetical protein
MEDAWSMAGHGKHDRNPFRVLFLYTEILIEEGRKIKKIQLISD